MITKDSSLYLDDDLDHANEIDKEFDEARGAKQKNRRKKYNYNKNDLWTS